MKIDMALRSTAATILVVSLNACVGGSVGSLTSGGYLNSADACYAERSAMAEQERFFDARNIGTAVGAGLVAGLIAGVVSQDVGTGVAVGVVTAGATLAASYIVDMQNRGLSASQIATRTSSDVAAENQRIDRLIRSFNALDRCRRKEARAIQRDYSRKRIDRAAAEEQMSGVRTRREADVAKFQEIAMQIDANSRGYAAVYNEIAADNGARGLVVQEPRRKVRRPRKAVKTAGTAQNSLAGVSSTKVSKLERDCLRNVRKRDSAFERVQRAKSDANAIALDAA